MKWLYLIVLLFFFILEGCSLFKKTNKTINKDVRSSTKYLEANELILKRAGKETQVFTYWNDSGFYQYQNIQEHVDRTKSGSLKAQEKQLSAQNSMNKKTGPVKLWVYIGTTTLVIGCILVYLMYIRKKYK